jgi:hypothetical protein
MQKCNAYFTWHHGIFYFSSWGKSPNLLEALEGQRAGDAPPRLDIRRCDAGAFRAPQNKLAGRSSTLAGAAMTAHPAMQPSL